MDARYMAVVVKTNGIPFWGRCTAHFRTYFTGHWDVHWGYGILTHGHIFTYTQRFGRVCVRVCVAIQES